MVWQNYKHRFFPWIALNWSTRQVKQLELKSSVHKETSAVTQLSCLCQKLDSSFPPCTVKEWKRKVKNPSIMNPLLLKARSIVLEELGFSLSLEGSTVDREGIGVFVSDDISEGKLVGLYPGTVYLPFEPLFFQSLRNPFIFRCVDGYMIDGRCSGISNLIFRSCAYRDTVNQSLSCDLTWLSTNPVNPLAIGQLVNNQTRDTGPNVEYVEISIPADFPWTWRRFLPNVFYSPPAAGTDNDTRLMRCIGLITTKNLQAREELLSSYITMVTGSE